MHFQIIIISDSTAEKKIGNKIWCEVYTNTFYKRLIYTIMHKIF